MKKSFMAFAVVTTLLITGCATQTGLIQKNHQTIPKSSDSQTFLFWGIGQEQSTDAAKVCGGAENVTKVQTVQQPMDIVLTALTLGIYSPRTAQVYCK